MKRTVLKKVSGLKKDQKEEWFGIVLEAVKAGDTIYQEKLVFVNKSLYNEIEEGHSYKFL